MNYQTIMTMTYTTDWNSIMRTSGEGEDADESTHIRTLINKKTILKDPDLAFKILQSYPCEPNCLVVFDTLEDEILHIHLLYQAMRGIKCAEFIPPLAHIVSLKAFQLFLKLKSLNAFASSLKADVREAMFNGSLGPYTAISKFIEKVSSTVGGSFSDDAATAYQEFLATKTSEKAVSNMGTTEISPLSNMGTTEISPLSNMGTTEISPLFALLAEFLNALQAVEDSVRSE